LSVWQLRGRHKRAERAEKGEKRLTKQLEKT